MKNSNIILTPTVEAIATSILMEEKYPDKVKDNIFERNVDRSKSMSKIDFETYIRTGDQLQCIYKQKKQIF